MVTLIQQQSESPISYKLNLTKIKEIDFKKHVGKFSVTLACSRVEHKLNANGNNPFGELSGKTFQEPRNSSHNLNPRDLL